MWGVARFPKPLPYLRPKSALHTANAPEISIDQSGFDNSKKALKSGNFSH